MNLARFHFSILRCTYLEEPFQHVHLLPTLREATLQSDRRQTYPELGITFLCAALRYSHAKLSGSRQAERPESNRNPGNGPVSLPLTYIPHNPDSRVSKVFNVSCLPRVASDILSIYLLQGGAYCLCERASHIDSNDTCRKLHPLFNLQIVTESVSAKDTHQRKEESMKMSMSSGINHLRIFPTNILYHRTFKKLWYMF